MGGETIATAYDIAGATGQILFMLLIAFGLGFACGYFVRPRNNSRQHIIFAGPRTEKESLPPPTLPMHQDDLTVVQGIEKAIERYLKSAGIMTLQQLASANPDELRAALKIAGDRFAGVETSTWPAQASLILATKNEA